MARLIQTPTGGGLVGPFERHVLQTLLQKLPDTYAVAPNFQLKQHGREALEYDFTVLAPHAVYVVEAKEWYGRLTGDDSEWLINQTPKRCPLWLANTKCKVLKSELGALGNQVYVSPVLVIPDGTQNLIGGSWGSHARSVTGLIAYLQDPAKVTRTSDVARYHKEIETVLQGKWGTRKRGARRRIGGYEITEVLYADERTGEYIAKRSLIQGDPTRYRIRTWRLDGALPPDAQEKQKAFIMRPTEAVLKIGPHPHLLRVLQFEFVDEDSEFFEVTEWSEFGTLHGYLSNKERGGLTLRERLEIAEGVASALEAVHAHDVVHRNLSPETIQVGFDRRPRLTDFDRAYMESKYTVYAASTARHVNEAYVPPELADATDYDFDTTSDMYSFGVLLYELLADETPFSDPKDAKTKQGKPAVLPSAIREGIDHRLDALILDLLRVDDFNARPAASQVLATLREVLGTTSAVSRSAPPPSPPRPQPETFEVGSLLRGTMRVDAVLGTGGFSRVLKVFHLDHQKYYALKVLFDAGNADLLMHEFNRVRPLLPRAHPNIAAIEWMERLDPPDRLPCLLTEFVDGETLEAYCDGRKRLPWTDIRRIALELLDALVVMHPDEDEYEQLKKVADLGELDEPQYEALMVAKERAERGLFHRDLKPANIMLAMPDHRAVLIDFNISSLASDQQSSGRTPSYCAPDWLTCGRASYDLFALGCVLYELVTQRHPFPRNLPSEGPPYDPKDIAPELRLSDDLAAFLFKAVQPSEGDRFRSAREMRSAFVAIDAMYAPAAPRSVTPGRFPGIAVSSEEAAKPNYNPYVTRLLTLYSQARRSNAGTRGLDDIARLTYVQTKLDSKLAPAISSGNYRLVIVTGNAGDGKTAFLEQVEALFRQNGATVERLPSRNGSRWEFQGVTYETNYDGSQDEGDRTNDAVLASFLAPFEGAILKALQSTEARLIAINEGRLLDFLAHGTFADRFSALRHFVLHALDGGEQPPRALLVNLNLRAITAGGAESLVEQQLVAMLKDDLWAPCAACAHSAKCPIKHNVDTLRDPTSGSAVRERVRRLFEVVHLRRRAHVTMRDLRSALSFLLLRDQSCDDVAKLLGRTDEQVTEDLARLYYPNAFADPEAPGQAQDRQSARRPGQEEERAVDRLVRRLRETDVGLVSAPILDRRLDHDPKAAVPWITFEGRSDEAWRVMHALTQSTPAPGDDLPFEALLGQRRNLQAMWRRWAYFERRDDGWRSMLPYRSIPLLERIVAQTTPEDGLKAREELRDKVVDAISLSEGVRNKFIRDRYLALKITRVKEARLRSYRLFPKDSFRVDVAKASGLVDYLEYTPDAVEVVAERGEGVACLRVSLDLLEMLELIGSGYRPTMSDLQGLFVNLLIFRNELLTTTFDEVLVTTDDSDFYRISAKGASDGIRLLLTKDNTRDASSEPGGAP
ncbi:MAG: protein kinase [Polyangiaceae bacterium]